MRPLVAVLLVCLLGEGTAVAREHASDARHHLKRANELAGEGKCAAAVKEYTAAYEKLGDPVVLFNRAECYRRLGENVKAVDDYRGFLAGFPGAPNRADIEAKIAALERPAAPAAPGPARTPPARTPAPVATQPPGPPARTPPPIAAQPQPAPRTPPARTPPVANAPAAPPSAHPAKPPVGPMPFLPPPPTTGGETNILVEAPRAEKKDTPPAETQGSRWWLWTSLAVVAVGGGVAGYIFLRPKDQPLPPVTLGNYRF